MQQCCCVAGYLLQDTCKYDQRTVRPVEGIERENRASKRTLVMVCTIVSPEEFSGPEDRERLPTTIALPQPAPSRLPGSHSSFARIFSPELDLILACCGDDSDGRLSAPYPANSAARCRLGAADSARASIMAWCRWFFAGCPLKWTPARSSGLEASGSRTKPMPTALFG